MFWVFLFFSFFSLFSLFFEGGGGVGGRCDVNFFLKVQHTVKS